MRHGVELTDEPVTYVMIRAREEYVTPVTYRLSPGPVAMCVMWVWYWGEG